MPCNDAIPAAWIDRTHTEIKWFQYEMKRADFPLGRRAGFQRGFRYRRPPRPGASEADCHRQTSVWCVATQAEKAARAHEPARC